MKHLRTPALRVTATMVVLPLIGVSIGRPVRAAIAPGEQRRWTLEFRVRLEQPGERPIEAHLSGDWVSTITAVRPREYDAEFELVNAHFTGNIGGNTPPGAAGQMQRRLTRPFWVSYGNDGEILTVHFFRDVTPSDRNLFQMITTTLQFVHPDPARPVWTVLERDGAGRYLSVYQVLQGNVVLKRKLKYVDTNGVAEAPPNGLQVEVNQSELRFSLDSEGGIVAAEGSDRVQMGVGFGNSGQLAATTEIHLTNLYRRRAPGLIGSLSRASPNVESSPVLTHKPDPEQIRAERDARLIGGRTTESLLQATMENEADQLLSDRLAALFRLRPAAPDAALALLKKSGPNRRITDALGSAASPKAIEALASLARDRSVTASLRTDALTAFIRMQNPSLEAMRIPADLLDDSDARIKFAARLTGGALAHAGRSKHPEEAEAIDQLLIARFGKAQDPAERSGLLAALGNSVGPSVVTVIEDALHDSQAPVRAAAARGLRLARGIEVDRLLAETITSDGDPDVRAAAIFATTFRHPIDPVVGEALVRAATKDPVDYIRSNAVTLLRQNPDASPRIAETLAWVAEHDDKPGIRRLAHDALTSISGKLPGR